MRRVSGSVRVKCGGALRVCTLPVLGCDARNLVAGGSLQIDHSSWAGDLPAEARCAESTPVVQRGARYTERRCLTSLPRRRMRWASNVARNPSMPLHTNRRVKWWLFCARSARVTVVPRRSDDREESLDDGFRNGKRLGTGCRGCDRRRTVGAPYLVRVRIVRPGPENDGAIDRRRRYQEACGKGREKSRKRSHGALVQPSLPKFILASGTPDPAQEERIHLSMRIEAIPNQNRTRAF